MGLLVDVGASTRAIEAASNSFVPPVTRGLISWHFLNDTLTKSRKNYAIAGLTATQAGTPTISPIALAIKSLSNFHTTEQLETTEMSFFVVCRSLDTLDGATTRPMMFGNYLSLPANGEAVASFGIGMYFNSATQVEFFACRGTSTANHNRRNVNITRTTPQQNAWSLIFCRVTATKNEMYDLTNSISISTTFADARFPAIGKLLIGSGYGGFSGSGDIALYAAHNVALTDAERDLQAARIRRYCAELPTPIVV